MLLKRLEAKGFKSFAEKVVIDFTQGVTCVVGPNGCGKSNIVDAIRWVLGEQSAASLRSDKMQEMIFNGSQDRKPLQMAEVSLLLENNRGVLNLEYNEVELTRRLYREGQSEYFINRVSCRLKDMEDLLTDTGIGSDTYSIIELNKVTAILNDREKSRMALFEKAAEVSKFKKRKKETMHKLNAIEGDLRRIKDLIFEIESNIKHLEKQAQLAKQYLKMKEQYQTCMLRYLYSKYQIQVQKQNAILQKQKDAQDDFARSISEIQKIEKDLSDAESDIEMDEQAVKKATEQFANKQMDIQKIQNQITLLDERTHQLKQQLQQIQEQREKNQSEQKQQQQRLQELENQQASQRKQLSTQQKQQQNLVSQLQKQKKVTQEAKQILEERKKEAQQWHTKYTHHLQELEFLKRQLQEVQGQKNQITKQLQARKDQVQKWTSLRPELMENLEKIRLQQKESVSFMDIQEKQQASDQAELEKLQETAQEKTRILDSCKNEYQLLLSLKQKMEGYSETVKFLSKSAQKPGVLLTDILSIRSGYAVAIENLLSLYLDYYVVETADQALQVIDFLNRENKGKAQFFILDQIPPPSTSNVPLPTEGVPALQVVSFEEKYKPLFLHLLSHAIICRDRKHILKNEVRTITQDGTLMKSSYRLMGGSGNLLEGKKIGRLQRIHQLKSRITELESHNAKISKKIVLLQNQIRERRKQLEKQRNTQMELHKKEQQGESAVLRTATQIEEYETLICESHLQITQLENKESQIQKNQNTTQSQSQSHYDRWKSIDSQANALENQYQKEQRKESKIEAELQSVRMQLIQCEAQICAIQKEISQSLENQQKQTQTIAQNEIRIKDIQKAQGETSIQSLQQKEDLIKLHRESNSLQKEKDNTESLFFAKKAHIQEVTQKLKNRQRGKEKRYVDLREYEKHITEVKIEIHSIEERASIEFHTDIASLPRQELYEGEDLLTQEKKAERLQRKIQSVGAVNHTAIEAYREAQNRLTFINAQKTDLENAKESLLATVEKVERDANKKFLYTFQKINANFKDVFRTLFSAEDSCEVVLSKDVQPMDSDIQIIAQPKGKKPTSVQQLSGGEKTLTAIALLFAIYLLKPAPFCIFDEVDAPLDDENIEKFINIIRSYSKKSQFIIVTHNKRTMSHADVIYGVTMMQKGVSVVVGVDLDAKP